MLKTGEEELADLYLLHDCVIIVMLTLMGVLVSYSFSDDGAGTSILQTIVSRSMQKSSPKLKLRGICCILGISPHI
jgi:hypothetical protein